jgi:hypothetical protein
MIRNILKHNLKIAVILQVFVLSLGIIFEPVIAKAIEDQFTVSQTITGEISFLTPASNVTMSGSLTGLTGGTSNGQTQVVVLTNDSSGYTMTIKASSSPAMQGDSQGGTISDYTSASASIPDYAFSVPTGYEFGYTVSASTTSDLAQKFLDNGSNACNTGSADTSGSTSCWYGLSTTATSTVVRATETVASGATTTVFFRVTINSGSSIPEDTYTATSTLTVVTN